MEKSISTPEYRKLLDLLRQVRKEAAITQVELADAIDESQSFVSKVERGEIRIDLVQLRTVVHAIGSSLPEFIERYEALLRKPTKRKLRR